MKYLNVVLMAMLAACATSPTSDTPAKLHGIVTKIDSINQTIELGALRNEQGSTATVVSYTSLTIVDTRHGTMHVQDLQFGDEVIVFGRRNATTDEIVADQIAVVQSASGS